MRQGGSRPSSIQLFILYFAVGALFVSNLITLIPVASAQTADPNACTDATNAEAQKAGLVITGFSANYYNQDTDSLGIGIALKFTTPKKYNATPKAFIYYKSVDGVRTDIPNIKVTGPKESGEDNAWEVSIVHRIPAGKYSFHATVIAKIDGTNKRACSKTQVKDIDFDCGKLHMERPFDKGKSTLQSVGKDAQSVNTLLRFTRYATDGSRCLRQSSQVSFPSGRKFRVLVGEADDSLLRSTTFYSLYEMLAFVKIGGQDHHLYAAVNKETGVLDDVVARRFRGEGSDENEEIWSWKLAKARGMTFGANAGWKETLMTNFQAMAGTKVRGYVTGKLREISITADFDIDYSGSEASTKNQKFTGTQTSLPELQAPAETEIQLWCAYEGQGQNHLFIDAKKFALPTNPSDGKWPGEPWKIRVFSGSCILTSFLTLTNDGTVPGLGGEPNYTGHGLVGINTERTFEDAVGTASSSTTDAIYLGLINRGREDLFAADQQFAVDKDETKPIPPLNPKFTHRATTTDVLAGLGPCNLLSLVQVATTQGIGAMLVRMIACIAKEVVLPMIEGLQEYIDQGVNYSRVLDSQPDNSSALARAPDNRGVMNLLIPSAHAQGTDTSKTTGFEGHLKDPNGVIVTIWKLARSLLNIVVILALLAIAFANIFHLNINTYAAKKALPGLVIGVVGANASLLIIRFLADVVQALSQLVLDMGGFPDVGALFRAFLFGAPYNMMIGSFDNIVSGAIGVLMPFVIIVVGIYYIFLVIAFVFAMLKRSVMLFFLTMVSPLAFAAYGLPQFQTYFYKWWDLILRQLFVWPVILFGAFMTVQISERIIVAQAVDSVSGFVQMAIVLAAAHFTLHLPKTFTKGAIDLAGAIKKATGFAPRIAQGAQWANDKTGQLRKSRYENKIQDLTRNGADQAKIARVRQKMARMEEGRSAKFLKGMRGYSKLVANPEILSEAMKARQERLEKDDKIAGLTKTNFLWKGATLPSLLRGPAAEAELAKKLGMDELKDARTAGDLDDWVKTLGGGHMKAVEGDLNIVNAMKQIANGDSAVFEQLRQKASNLKSQGEIDDFVKDLAQRSGLDVKVKSVKDYHDVMKWSAYQSAVTRVSRGIRDTEEGEDPYEKNARKVARSDPKYSLYTPPPGTGGAPGGAPAPFVSPGGAQASASRVAQFTDEQIQARIEEIFNHSTALNPDLADDIQEKFVRNLDALGDLEQMSPGEGMYKDVLEKTRQTLLDAVSQTSGADAEQLRDAIRQASDPAQLTRLTENLSLAAAARGQGNTKESIASIVSQASQGTREFHQAHNDLMSQTDLAKLEGAMTSALQSGNQDLAGVLEQQLGEGINKLSGTLGKQLNPDEQRKMFQQMATQIQTSMVGPGQKTLRAILQSSLASIPKSFAKVVGVHTLKPQAMEVNVTTTPGDTGTQVTPPTEPPATT